ncbi:MAG: hypothetical protein LBU51_01545 [Bacteroidales bacterium]|jgi:hypothetical protein|nr:hypothetical protein [Bacteroidales bacterium]
MKRIKILLFFAAVLLFAACDKENVTYYFREKEADKLLPLYTVGKILTFKNELGEERQLKVTKSEQEIRAEVWHGTYYSYYFSYETKYIVLSESISQKECFFYFKQYPIDVEKAKLQNFHKFRSHLLGTMDDVSLDFKKTLLTRNVNGVNYTGVLELQGATFSRGYFSGVAEVIYYDIFQGLIEFHDTSKHQWKLVNN